MGNQLVAVQVSCVLHFMLQGIFLGTNPELSQLWIHPDVLEPFGSLVKLPGVFQAFRGSRA